MFYIIFLFFDLGGMLFFKQISNFVPTVHPNFHAKSRLCSSRNERVMLNFAIWWPFCFLVTILFLKKKSKFVQTVHTNCHAKSGLCSSKMSELCPILRFVQTVHMNFHAKSGLCSSRNERVMLNFAIWRPFCF